jgi:RpiR family carbohydrate utilization transcriptional regulator
MTKKLVGMDKEHEDTTIDSFEKIISEKFDTLTVTEKRVAKYILSNESDIVWYSVASLAEKTNTSEAAIIRTCKKLGYKGFQDLKISIALSLLHPLSEKERKQEIKTNGDKSETKMINKLYEMHVKCIKKVYSEIDFKEMKKIADVIMESKSIYLFAVGATKAVAADVNHKLLRLGKNTFLSCDNREQDMIASLADDKSVIWAFSFFGGKESFYDKLLTAKENGATIISLINNKNSSMAKISDHILVGSSDWLSSFLGTTDRLSQFTIVDIFFTYLLHLGYPDAHLAMEKTQSVIEKVTLLD